MPERLLNRLSGPRLCGLAVVLLATALSPQHAVADQAARDKPWTRGVTDEAKARAKALLERGNELFVANQHKDALVMYEQALAAWEHPAIQFNAVRALVALDRPIEALDRVDKALQYGEAPLEEAVYAEALNYQRMLRNQVGTLVVTCTQPGVSVAIDGERRITCPGSVTVRVRPGRHVVVGNSATLATGSIDVIVMGGATESIAVQLSPPDLGPRTRWASWKPWAVVVGGVVLGGTAVVIRERASRDADSLSRQVADQCDARCSPDQYRALGLEALEAQIDRRNTYWVSSAIAGGVLTVLGVSLVVLNRPTHERPPVAVGVTGALDRIAITLRAAF